MTRVSLHGLKDDGLMRYVMVYYGRLCYQMCDVLAGGFFIMRERSGWIIEEGRCLVLCVW